MRIVLILAVALVAMVGCQPTTAPPGANPTTQPSPIVNGPTNNQNYNTVLFALQNAEAIANQLAGLGVIPQADVTIAENLANAAMQRWLANINGTVTPTASEAPPESVARKQLSSLEAIVAEGQQKQALSHRNH